MLKRILFLLALAIMASPFLFAQVTTSAITGTVKSATDEALVGATVVATHTPSGTKYTAVSRAGGVIRIDNMRPGGPYSIEITHIGFDKETYNDIYLQLAESFILAVSMNKSVTALETVVLTTGRRTVFNPNRTGAVTNVNLRQITMSPSINRNILDITRSTPQANGQAIGGGNARQNNFTVDGAEFNNSFGIQVGTSGNIPGSGSPISFDALDEVSISITPFDVRQSGFIGSGINAVTRAGTNTFSGSVYHYYRTEKLRGRKVGKSYFVRPLEEYDQWGARLGGPIIKNKLFFFFSYEQDKQPLILQTRTASSPSNAFGSSPTVVRPTVDSLNYISQYLLTNYEYETGEFDNYSQDIIRKKYLGRIDWNISSRHRAVLRYSQIEGNYPSPASTSSGGIGSVAGSGNRADINSIYFRNTNYLQGTNFYSLAAELNSNWGRISNTFRGTYTFTDETRSSEGKVFPLVDIMSTTGVTPQAGSGVGSVYAAFGYEPFSLGNIRKVKVYSVIDNVSWTKNKHSWTLGAQFEQSETINGFQPFAQSYYRYATWADFESALNPNPALRKLPTDFAVTFSLSKDFAPAFSAFKFRQLTLYAQDEIAVTRDFRLTVGLRIERPTYPPSDQIITNPLVLAMNFPNGEKLNTGKMPPAKLMFSPRVGFNWDLYGDRSLQIRGGIGIFTSKIPFVWIVSQSGNSGMIQITQFANTYTAGGGLTGAPPPGPFNPDPAAYRPAVVPASGTQVPGSNLTVMADNFKNPQSLKSSLAIDTRLPGGIIATIEGIFNKDIYTATFRSPNYQNTIPLGTLVPGSIDNRPIYGITIPSKFFYTLNAALAPVPGGANAFTPVVIENGTKGYYGSLTIKLEKTYAKGFSAFIAYTKSIAGNLHDGGGDQVGGVYSFTEQVNGPNSTKLSHASYVVPDRVVAAISYRKEYFKHLATAISIFYSGSAATGFAGRFSYVYNGDFNRDNISGNDLIYIPNEAQVKQMQFASQVANGVTYDQNAQRTLFEAYIQQDKYLRTHRGQYAERNGALLPWRNQLDVKFVQDLFIKTGKSKNTLQFSIDIVNAGNLISPTWGKRKFINNSQILNISNPNNVGTIPAPPPAPQIPIAPIFRLALDRGNIITSTFRDDVSINSTYQIQFGLRYLFN